MNVDNLKNGYYWITLSGEDLVANYYNGYFIVPGDDDSKHPNLIDNVICRVENPINCKKIKVIEMIAVKDCIESGDIENQVNNFLKNNPVYEFKSLSYKDEDDYLERAVLVLELRENEG